MYLDSILGVQENTSLCSCEIHWAAPLGVPSSSGWYFPRAQAGISLDLRLLFASSSGWYFPRAQAGISLELSLVFPSGQAGISLELRLVFPSSPGWYFPPAQAGISLYSPSLVKVQIQAHRFKAEIFGWPRFGWVKYIELSLHYWARAVFPVCPGRGRIM